jgi:threonine dehydratase
MARVSADDIKAAPAALAGIIPVTPAVPSTILSEKLGCRLTLKLENLTTPAHSKSVAHSTSCAA